MEKWTEEQIAYILENVDKHSPGWAELAVKYNKKFGGDRNSESLRKCYYRYRDIFDASNVDYEVKILKDIHRAKKSRSLTAKENKTVLQLWSERDDLLDQFKELISQVSIAKYKTPKSLIFNKSSNKKKNMTLELLFGDVHFGKLTLNEDGGVKINCQEIRKRVAKISGQLIKEIQRSSVHYNMERLVIAMLGDIIESSHMHGEESVKGCEFGTSKQMNEAIISIYHDLLVPLSQTGLPIIDIVCVTGNHDRLDKKQTYIRPGENNLTYVIYKQLELLCQVSNLTNIKFHISNKMYSTTIIYDRTVVYEHGHELTNLNRDTITKLMNKRQTQLGTIVDFYRVGHWHERVEYGQGKMQVNGSVPGQDDYSLGKGFDSEALQVLNYYIQTNKRRTSFFRSFPIYLEEIL